MKRHPALAHLSRDHHPALMLAQLLKENAPPYKGLPTDNAGKLRYAETFYRHELNAHFEQEEKMLEMIPRNNGELNRLIEQIKAEHALLHKLFVALADTPEPAMAMNILGHTLELHVRKEERQLFPLIEANCNEEQMAWIESIFTSG